MLFFFFWAFLGHVLPSSFFPSFYTVGASTSCLGRHDQGEKLPGESAFAVVSTTGQAFAAALSLCSPSSGHESLDFMCGLLCLRIPEELLPADVLDGRRRWGGSARSFRSADTRLLGGMEHDGIVVLIILATVQHTRSHAVSRRRSRGARGEAVGTTCFQRGLSLPEKKK